MVIKKKMDQGDQNSNDQKETAQSFNLSDHSFSKNEKKDQKKSQVIQEENLEDLKNFKKSSKEEVPSEKDFELEEEESQEDKYLRLRADFENFRKRMRKERLDLIRYGNQSMILEILNVIDNFDRALQSARLEKNIDNVIKGIEMIQNQIMQVLKSQGIEPMKVQGEIFDPHSHEAISFEEVTEKQKDGRILEELQRGYKQYEKVIRVPKVKVLQLKEK